MQKKKTIAIIMTLLICTSVIIAYATINSPTEAKNYKNPFTDVNELDWFYGDIQYVCENKLMNGTSDTEFSPMGATTRGMIVTILWRLEGEPIEDGKIFEDVSKDTYYYNAVAWASNNNIVSGYDEKIFAPDDTATREQLSTIMYRYASYKKYDISKETELDKYIDKGQISEYAVQSIKWANANGIISGTSAETISPKDDVQRCQVAAILKRFCNNVVQVEDNEESKPSVENSKQEDIVKELEDKNTNQQEGDNETSENDTPTPPSTSTGETNDIYASPTLIVGKANASPGDEVQIAVDLKCNPGILGMTLTLYYDETMCSLQSAENGEAINNILDLTTSKTLGNGARFVWDGIEISEEDIKDGEILILTFKINDNADEGICPITLKYFENDILDNNLVTVSPHIKNGEIIITK